MGFLSGFVYSTGVKVYKILPFKKQVCDLLKSSGLVGDRFYRDFRFNDEFNVETGSGAFKMHHYGGPIENETYWKGLFNSFEEDTGWIWMQLAPVCNSIFDVGANTGLYSLVASVLNPKAAIHAFEPSKNTYDKLKHNCAINGFEVKCWQVALSNVNGSQTFYDTLEQNQTSASLSPDKLKNFEGYSGEMMEYEIQTQRLDSFIPEHQVQSIDLMKIDVEMHEPEVIEGFGELLKTLKPIVLIEVLTEEVADKLNAMIGDDFLKFHLEGVNKARQVQAFSPKEGLWNFVVFHKDKEQLVRESTTLFR